jgi:hypothetical protein
VRTGVRDLRLSGPGALARSIPNEVLRMLVLTVFGQLSELSAKQLELRSRAAGEEEKKCK